MVSDKGKEIGGRAGRTASDERCKSPTSAVVVETCKSGQAATLNSIENEHAEEGLNEQSSQSI